MSKITGLQSDQRFATTVLSMLFDADAGDEGIERGMQQLFIDADRAIESGSRILVLSDRGVDEAHAPIPALLAISGLHHHLVREKKRAQVGLVVETGEAREVHHFALLIGFGANVINPYLALDSLSRLKQDGYISSELSTQEAEDFYLNSVIKGVVKVMSKMGISTVHAYRGAQIFEAIGLNSELVDTYFTKVASRIQGIGLVEIGQEALGRHQR